MARASYNQIYSTLVENEKDVVGAAAYAIYKRQKIEYVEGIKSIRSAGPTKAEMDDWHQISMSTQQISLYRQRATIMLHEIIDTAFEKEREKIEFHYLTEQGEVLNSVLGKYYLHRSKKHKWGEDLLIHIVGGIGLSIVITIFYLTFFFDWHGIKSWEDIKKDPNVQTSPH